MAQDRLSRYAEPAAPATDRLARYAEPADASPERTWGDWVGALVRGASGLVPGGPLGAIAGGAGEIVGQLAERASGSRKAMNWWQVPAQAGIGFVPFGKAATLLRSTAKGAAMGAGGAGITAGVESASQGGDLDDILGDVWGGAKFGAGLGAAGGAATGVLSKFLSNRAPRPPADLPDVEVGGGMTRVGQDTIDEWMSQGSGLQRVRTANQIRDRLAPYADALDDIPDPMGLPATSYSREIVPSGRATELGARGRFNAPVRRPEDIVSDDVLGLPAQVTDRNRFGGPVSVAPDVELPWSRPGVPIASAPPKAFDGPPGTPQGLKMLPEGDSGPSGVRPPTDRLAAYAGGRASGEGASGPAAPGFAIDPPPGAGRPTSTDVMGEFLDVGERDAASSAAALDPQVRARLQRMLDDMESQGYQPKEWKLTEGGEVRTAANTPLAELGQDYVPYVPAQAGAPIFHDIMGGKAGNRQAVIKALQRVLAGGKPGAIGQRALELAQQEGKAPDFSHLAGTFAKPEIPPEIVDAWTLLRPKWAQTVAAQAGDDIPFTVDPAEPLEEFARRVLGSDVKSLMGIERKARKALEARLGAGDEGFTDPEVLFPIASTAAGAAVGPWMDEDNPLRGAGMGAAAGLGLGLGGRRFMNRIPEPPTARTPPPRSPGRFDLGPMGDDTGAVSRELAMTLGAGGAGALAGPLVSDDPTVGALGGAGTGLLAAAALRNPRLLTALSYSNILSGAAVPTSLSGNVGGVLAHAAEAPSMSDAARRLREFFSPATAADVPRAFKDRNLTGTGRYALEDDTPEWLTYASRALGAPDYATRQAMQRAGASAKESGALTLSGDPTSAAGKLVVHAAQNPFIQWFLPVAKTAANLVERGAERIPGVGSLPAVRKWSGASDDLARRRQILGALAAVAGAGVGAETAPGGYLEDVPGGRYATALLGPYALPGLLGTAAGSTAVKEYDKGSDLKTGGLSALKAIASQGTRQLPMPGPWSTDVFDPATFLRRMVPYGAAGRFLSPVDSKEFDVSGDPLFGPSIAQIPYLNELLLERGRPVRR